MPSSTFTPNFKFALSTDEDFFWGKDFRDNLDKADKSIKEMQNLAASFFSMVNAHLSSADHDWRYYNNTEMDNNKLGTRYYTKTDFSNGALDTYYASKSQTYAKSEVYSKVEMDSIFRKKSDFQSGTSFINTLDARYYTKTQIDNGALDDLFYTKSQTDALLSQQGVDAAAALSAVGVKSHISKYQIRQNPTEPVNLSSDLISVGEYATILSSYPYVQQSISMVYRYGFPLSSLAPGFPAGYPCQFIREPDKFIKPDGSTTDSVWIPVAVNELEAVNSSGVPISPVLQFGGKYIHLQGTEVKPQYASTIGTILI